MHFMGKLGLEKVSKRSRRDPDHEKTFLTFTLSVNKIILYQFSMFKSLDSIASVVGMFMYLTISKLKQVLRSRKGLDYNTGTCRSWHSMLPDLIQFLSDGTLSVLHSAPPGSTLHPEDQSGDRYFFCHCCGGTPTACAYDTHS